MHDLSLLSFYIIPLFLCLQFWKDTWLLRCQILVQMLLQFVSIAIVIDQPRAMVPEFHTEQNGYSQPMPGPELDIYFCVNLVMKDYKEYNNKGYDNICLLPWDVSRLS